MDLPNSFGFLHLVWVKWTALYAAALLEGTALHHLPSITDITDMHHYQCSSENYLHKKLISHTAPHPIIALWLKQTICSQIRLN